MMLSVGLWFPISVAAITAIAAFSYVVRSDHPSKAGEWFATLGVAILFGSSLGTAGYLMLLLLISSGSDVTPWVAGVVLLGAHVYMSALYARE